jgi:membrane protease YdiL (CAAX protease family)
MTLKDKYVFPLVVYIILYAITVPFIYLVKPYLIPDVISIIHKLAVIAVFLVLILKYIKNRKVLFKLPKPSARVVTLIFVLFTLFATNNYLLSNYSTDYSYLDLGTTTLALSILAMTISSTAEEVMYRGFIQSYTNQALSSNTKTLSQGNLYATFFFFLGHIGFYTVMDPIFATTGLLLAVIFSLSAGYIRDKTGSLIWPIIIHILCNYIHLALNSQHFS